MATSKLKAESETLIRRMLTEGFLAPDEVVDVVTGVLSEEKGVSSLRRVASKLLPAMAAARAEEMRSWPAVTDCDRLDAAFEELNTLGIMARHDWTCCGTCGRTEMKEEFDELDGEWEGVPITGYVFYHSQATQEAAEGGELYLCFGSYADQEDEGAFESSQMDVRRTVCDVLTEHGLAVGWDGTLKSALSVDMKWQRRTPPARFI